MSGYIQRPREPLGRDQKIAIALAFVAGILLLVGAFAAAENAPAWLLRFDFGLAPLGVLQILLGLIHWQRARTPAEDERISPRSLKLAASIFFLIGAAMIALGVHDYFQGA